MSLRNISIGSKGPDVMAVQQGLNKYYGRQVLVPDGDFGHNTLRVVKQFQAEKRMLPPDGVVGPVTRSALFPLVAVTVNLWGSRLNADRQGSFSAVASGERVGLGLGFPGPIPLPIPPGLLSGFAENELITPPGISDPIPAPKVATPPAGRIVVDWQQLAQSQRQFDGLFRNPQDTFALGFQSVFKRQQLSETDHHLEIATGCLFQYPMGFLDAQGNPVTMACFAQATWVESLGRSGVFQWAPYVTAQGQGNLSGPANATATVGGFPASLNVNLGKIRSLGFDDVTVQFSGGVNYGVQFKDTGLRIKSTTLGPALGVGLTGNVWFLGR